MIFNPQHVELHCSYCMRSRHLRKNCHMLKRHLLFRGSNIPAKYWQMPDPAKIMLMHENMHGFINREKNQLLVQRFFTPSLICKE